MLSSCTSETALPQSSALSTVNNGGTCVSAIGWTTSSDSCLAVFLSMAPRHRHQWVCHARLTLQVNEGTRPPAPAVATHAARNRPCLLWEGLARSTDLTREGGTEVQGGTSRRSSFTHSLPCNTQHTHMHTHACTHTTDRAQASEPLPGPHHHRGGRGVEGGGAGIGRQIGN